MSDTPVQPVLHTFVLGDYQTNCFVVTLPDDSSCWIVDCGYDPSALLDFVESEGLHPEAILLTHTHADHIAGLPEARSRFGDIPTYVHRAERGFCSDPMLNLSALAGMPVSVPEPDRILEGGEELSLGPTTWRVLHTPGHSPGGVCYIHDESHQAIVGDTLFAGSMGRVDFPTSDPEEMRKTLGMRIMSLPDDYAVHPGHGPSTTIGRERQTNPFLKGGW